MTRDAQPDRCQSLTRTGARCSAVPVDGRRCAWHSEDPVWVAKRREWSKAGGAASSHAARAKKKLAGDLRDVAGVKALLLESMEATKNGEMEPNVLTALATAARAVVVVAGVADFEEQLATMRADIARFAEQRGNAS
jgi:hypothetical protein